MHELTNALESVIVDIGADDDAVRGEFELNPSCEKLQRMSGEWAKMAVLTFSGDLLDRALDVSKSIAKFTSEMATPGSTRSGV